MCARRSSLKTPTSSSKSRCRSCLLDFVTHVVGYKAVLAKWGEGNYAERRSTIGWPPEFDSYVERSYQALKAEQTRLMHNGLWRLWRHIFKASNGKNT